MSSNVAAILSKLSVLLNGCDRSTLKACHSFIEALMAEAVSNSFPMSLGYITPTTPSVVPQTFSSVAAPAVVSQPNFDQGNSQTNTSVAGGAIWGSSPLPQEETHTMSQTLQDAQKTPAAPSVGGLPPASYKKKKAKKTKNNNQGTVSSGAHSGTTAGGKKNNKVERVIDTSVAVDHTIVSSATGDHVVSFCGNSDCDCCYYFQNEDDANDKVRTNPGLINPNQLYIYYANKKGFETLEDFGAVLKELSRICGGMNLPFAKRFLKKGGYGFLHFYSHDEASRAQNLLEDAGVITNFALISEKRNEDEAAPEEEQQN